MKKILSVVFMVGLMLAVFTTPGCVTAEYRVVKSNGEIHTIKYTRAGDQELSGLDVGKDDPNGIKFWAKLETQRSEGKLQIEGVILALAELAANLTGQGLIAEAGQVMGISSALQGTVVAAAE